MKKSILAVALLIGFGACPVRSFADETNVVVTTLLDDGSTNTWTQADLVAALQLMNRRYHRDIQSESGRVAWHGRKTREVVDTNALVKVSYYADGMAFTDPAKLVTPAASVEASNAKLAKPVMTNGVPAKLAAARLRRQAEVAQGVSNVTVTVTAGGK